MKASTYEAMDNVPWDRIVHWYGRATDVPGLIEALKGDQHAAASARLTCLLEHQDGVAQATPFAVAKIISNYSAISSEQRVSAGNVLSTIRKSSEFTLSSPRVPDGLLSISQLLSPEFLWPPYENDETDEELWEERHISEKEYYSYAKATLHCMDHFVP